MAATARPGRRGGGVVGSKGSQTGRVAPRAKQRRRRQTSCQDSRRYATHWANHGRFGRRHFTLCITGLSTAVSLIAGGKAPWCHGVPVRPGVDSRSFTDVVV